MVEVFVGDKSDHYMQPSPDLRAHVVQLADIAHDTGFVVARVAYHRGILFQFHPAPRKVCVVDHPCESAYHAFVGNLHSGTAQFLERHARCVDILLLVEAREGSGEP